MVRTISALVNRPIQSTLASKPVLFRIVPMFRAFQHGEANAIYLRTGLIEYDCYSLALRGAGIASSRHVDSALRFFRLISRRFS